MFFFVFFPKYVFIKHACKKVSKYDKEIPQSQTSDKPVARDTRKKKSKATSSLFSIAIIVNLELTQSNAQQNVEQLQNPKMGVLEQSTTNQHQQNPV